MGFLYSYIKNHIYITIGSILGVIIISYFLFSGNPAPKYDFFIIKKGDVIQEVSVTGRVKAAQDVNLAFEKSGRLSRINVEVGDEVRVGQILLQQDNADLAAQLSASRATLKSQEAKLSELLRGTRQEEINVQEVKVLNAKTSLDDSKKVLMDRLRDAYLKSDDAIRAKADQLFNNIESASPTLIFTPSSSQFKNEIEDSRVTVGNVLSSWEVSLNKLTISSDLVDYVWVAKASLGQIKIFLDKVSLTLSTLSINTNLTQATIDSWKSDVSTGRTNVSTATINLSTAEESWRSSESALALAEKELVLEKAGTIEEQINAQKANVDKAAADVQNYEAQLSKTYLRSPINGIVTKIDAKAGEIVSASAEIISVISGDKFQIEVNIPEADIAKIKIGDEANLTLDAYSNDDIFLAKVIKIDPAETMIEGVATYKTTLQFANSDSRVKSGMTANVDIVTAKAENAIFIPQRALLTKDGNKFVRVLEGNEVKEAMVKVGIKGLVGYEILEGLKENDKVITSLE
ncbi:MAG: efflux RND transporter periplasmic adaptor subunit [bacterium]|nr:efflux RND transporter periplasmic adaptor subunit [bacterium]